VSAPIVEECYTNLECKVVDTKMASKYNLFICEVVNLVDFVRLNQLVRFVDRKFPPTDLIGAIFILACVLSRSQYVVAISGLEPKIGVIA
jgi:hypothetical protein